MFRILLFYLTPLKAAMNWEEWISRIFHVPIFPELIVYLFAGFSHHIFYAEKYVQRVNFVNLNRTNQRICSKEHCGIKRKLEVELCVVTWVPPGWGWFGPCWASRSTPGTRWSRQSTASTPSPRRSWWPAGPQRSVCGGGWTRPAGRRRCSCEQLTVGSADRGSSIEPFPS